jgi:RNA recognition motif-containing protein
LVFIKLHRCDLLKSFLPITFVYYSACHYLRARPFTLHLTYLTGFSLHRPYCFASNRVRFSSAFYPTNLLQDGSPIDWLTAQTLAINSRDFNDMDILGGRESVNLPQYKTVMCRFFASSEGCGWGTKCHFAHSEEELIGAERIDGHLMGAGGSLSDDGSDQSIKNFKTKLCTHHEKTGKCPHGAKCTFAHGMMELRGALSSAAICIRPPVGIDTRPSSANSLGSSTGSEKGDDYMSARKVFVGGLPHFIQSDDLWEFFEGEFGKVVDAVVICGVDTDGKVRSRGFGFVVFHDPRHANIACKRHYLPFRGKKVEVKRAMARVDYGDEPIKFNSPTFPSGASSPVPPTSSSQHSPVPQQAWSLPPLGVDSLRKPSQESTQLSPSNSISLSERASSFGSEMNNNHLMPQYGAPPLSHLSLNHSGSSPLQNNSRSQFPNFGPLFSQSTSFSLDSGLDTSSFLLDSSAAFPPSPGFTSPSNSSKPLNHFSMNGSSVPYSNGTSFDSTVTRVKHDIDHPSQSFFSSTPGPSLYPHGSDPVAPAADDEEFSELLAMLSETK